MDITITGRNVGVTDRFREYATEKAGKIDHLADKAIAFEVKVARHHETRGSSGDDRVELTLIGPGPLVRAALDAEPEITGPWDTRRPGFHRTEAVIRPTTSRPPRRRRR